jgi:tripartite-type tricarboxylate transporter receptor subunit TctC
MDHGARHLRMARMDDLKRVTKRILERMAVLVAVLAGAVAEGYPTKPVKIVVPFASGGNLDVTARLIAESMAKQLGQAFIVENRPGAGGVLGSEMVAKSPADGYTLVAGTTATTVVSPLLVSNPPYRLDSFSPVGLMAVTPLVLEVPASSPHADFKSFLAAVKSNPGKITIGHSGNGTTNHIAIVLLQYALKLDLVIIPYKGSGPALIDLVGGHLDSMVDQTSSSLPQIRAGKARPLAVLGRSRIADLADVPTLAEQGVNDFDVVTPSGLLAPAGTPPGVVKTLNTALNKALADPAIQKKLGELGSEIRPVTPEQFDRFLRGEEARLKALVKAGVLKGG